MRTLFFLSMLLWGAQAIAESGVVLPDARASLRSGKTDNYRVIRVLPPQTTVEILQIDRGYARVQTAEGETGWLPARLLELQTDAQNKAAQTQQAIDGMRQELRVVQGQLTETQAMLELERSQQRRQNIMLYAGIALALLIGIGAGILIREAYYRKRLNGLRI